MTDAVTSVGARSSFAAPSGPAAAFSLSSASGPSTRKRQGFVTLWLGAQQASSSSSSSVAGSTGSWPKALCVRRPLIASSTSTRPTLAQRKLGPRPWRVEPSSLQERPAGSVRPPRGTSRSSASRCAPACVVGKAVTQAFLPALRAGRGRIVNVSSIGGRMALPLGGPYSASKFALEGASDSLRQELRGAVGVIVVEPGGVKTPIWSKGGAAADELLAEMPGDVERNYGSLVAGMRREAEKIDRETGLEPAEVAQVIAGH